MTSTSLLHHTVSSARKNECVEPSHHHHPQLEGEGQPSSTPQDDVEGGRIEGFGYDAGPASSRGILSEQ